MAGREGKALVYLVVDEWDTSDDELDPEESSAIAEDTGAVPGRAFGFTGGDVASMAGLEPDDSEGISLAIASLVAGPDEAGLLDGMLDRASDITGWCVLASHVRTE